MYTHSQCLPTVHIQSEPICGRYLAQYLPSIYSRSLGTSSRHLHVLCLASTFLTIFSVWRRQYVVHTALDSILIIKGYKLHNVQGSYIWRPPSKTYYKARESSELKPIAQHTLPSHCFQNEHHQHCNLRWKPPKMSSCFSKLTKTVTPSKKWRRRNTPQTSHDNICWSS